MEIIIQSSENQTEAVSYRLVLGLFSRVLVVFGAILGSFVGWSEAQTIEYSIGDPSAEEQLSLELINRARANPAAEGIRLAAVAAAEASVYSDVYSFGTNLTTMKSEMAAISPAQPLSFNEILMGTALTHNNNMLASNSQTHYSSGSAKHYLNRMDNSGYVWWHAGENIFAKSSTVSEAHASFEIDWGTGSGGMQSNRGHRDSIHSKKFREIGVSYMAGSASNIGPFLVTQNFGEINSLSKIRPYVTGVAINDADGDGFYDLGEGIEGVRVEVVNSSTGAYEDHYAVTSGSGGYSVPIDGGGGEYRVEFTLPDGVTQSFTVTLEGEVPSGATPVWELLNKKIDLILDEASTPAYTPPVITAETSIPENSTTVVSFESVIGAQEYEVLVAELIEDPLGQDAVVDAPVTTDKSSSYSLVKAAFNQGDRLAFHLNHPSSASDHQSMVLDRTFVPRAGGAMTFASRMRRTGTAQLAVVQVSTDEGASWEDVWFQQSNFSYANALSPVSIDVSDYEGQPIKFRFQFYLGGGSVEYGTSYVRGWHFDDIEFLNMSELVSVSRTTVAANEFPFTPTESGDCHVQVRAKTGSTFLRYADASIFAVTSNDYAGWGARQESAAGVPAGTFADSESDYDGDGLSQLAEYALAASGLDPAISDVANVPTAEIEGETLCVHYKVDTSLTDVTVGVQVSTDLTTWYSPGDTGAPAGFSDTLDAPAVGTLEDRTAAVPLGDHEALYMRVRVMEIAPES